MKISNNKKLFIFYLSFISLFLSFVLISCDKLPILDKFTSKKETEVQMSEEALNIPEVVLARVDDWYMGLDEFEEKVRNLELIAPDFKVDSFEDKKALLEEFVRQQLLVEEAKRRGLDKNKEIQGATEEFLRGLLVREIINREFDKITVSSAEIEDHYSQYREGFREPEQFRVREIVVGSELQAKEILIELLKGADFASLARQRSISESAKKGGDLGIIKEAKFAQFANAVMSLEIGGISNVFKGPDGYYIVKLEDKKGGKLLTLTEVWDDIKNGLLIMKQNQYIQDFIANLRQNAQIEISEDLLR